MRISNQDPRKGGFILEALQMLAVSSPDKVIGRRFSYEVNVLGGGNGV
jgi:hypothetical protein